jgi:hypothetical protein
MMNPARFAIASHRNRTGAHSARAITLAVLTVALLSACKTGCPPGLVKEGGWCRRAGDAAVDGGADAERSGSGVARAGAGGIGTMMGAASAAGANAAMGTANAGNTKSPPIDPTIEWMCMKNAAGECTSCKQDSDCPKHVCEQSFCMDCRDASQCGAADSCIANRCVPERTPSSLWTTAGGGQTSATGFKVQLSVGSPSPATNASAAGFKLNVAPGAGLF